MLDDPESNRTPSGQRPRWLHTDRRFSRLL